MYPGWLYQQVNRSDGGPKWPGATPNSEALLMDRRNLLYIFGGAFLAATLVTWLLYQATAAPKVEKTQAVVAAAIDLPAGTLITKNHLKRLALPAKDLPKGALMEDGEAVNRVLLFPLSANEPFNAGRLTSPTSAEGVAALIEPGKRAVSVSVSDSSAASGLIQPRSRVDVLFTKTGGMAEAVTSTVLEDIRVLSVGRMVELPSATAQAKTATTSTTTVAPAANTGPRSVTLLVTPEQARVLELAKNQGRISLSLRNPKDDGKSEGEGIPSVGGEAIDPLFYMRNAKARLAAQGRLRPKGFDVSALNNDKEWAKLIGQDMEANNPGATQATTPPAGIGRNLRPKEPTKPPRHVIDVFRGDKHVQETFQE